MKQNLSSPAMLEKEMVNLVQGLNLTAKSTWALSLGGLVATLNVVEAVFSGPKMVRWVSPQRPPEELSLVLRPPPWNE